MRYFLDASGATTLGANTTFAGVVISNAGVTIGANTTWEGQSLAFGGTITTDTNTISVPICAAAPATLHVIKNVINDNGGTAVASDFNLHVTLSGIDVAGSPALGTAVTGTSYSLPADTYVISEDANASYTRSFSGDCDAGGNIILAPGDDKTCTVTNNDVAPAVPATLHIVKTVVNDNGGTAVASDFIIDVTGTNVSTSSFAGSAAGVDVTLDPGAYTVSEAGISGYLQSGSGDCSGTIAAGETKTCTITNDDIAPQLIVNKIVVNDNGGTKVISDFQLFIDGGSVASGVASSTAIGLHTVSETADSGYTTTIGGNCAADGTITLALGDVKTCAITNDDIAPVVVPPSSPGSGSGSLYNPPMPPILDLVPPIIDVVKVPSPLSLPAGPGMVKYTYTLSNIGTVPVSDVTMVGDTCSPITLISGDANSDAKLDVGETWVYTCSINLTKTHTNVVTAIGWANGISATDIANATVIVGVPVIPPLIHVTKVPSPLALSAGGGMVTYTNKVTNPGIVALSNVRLIDDECGPVEYISGDTNEDSKLDINETWTYTCSAKLTKTTVNTITASGDANGLTARDFAIVTVVVNAAVPKLPNTGLPPGGNDIPWNVVVPAGIFGALILFYFVRKKHIAQV